MAILIPLFTFLLGLGVHRWVSRFLRAFSVVRLTRSVEELTTRREELRFRAYILNPVAFVEHLQREDVRREIEQLIEDTKR